MDLDYLVLPIITDQLSQIKLHRKSIILSEDHSLADTLFDVPGIINLVISSEYSRICYM